MRNANKVLGITIVMLSVVLTSCGLLPANYKWRHPTKSEMEIQSDHEQCLQKVSDLYPYKEGDYQIEHKEIQSGAPARVTCKTYKYETICNSWPAIPEKTIVKVEKKHGDANSVPRSAAYQDCMKKIDLNYECIDDRFVGLENKVHGAYCGAKK